MIKKLEDYIINAKYCNVQVTHLEVLNCDSKIVLNCDSKITANTKYLYNIYTMLDQRQGRWAEVVQMLYKCFVIAGIKHWIKI